MAIQNLISFDHHALGPVPNYSFLESISPINIPGYNQGWGISSGLVIADYVDEDGLSRRYLTSGVTPGSLYIVLSNFSQLDRTGKWTLGVRTRCFGTTTANIIARSVVNGNSTNWVAAFPGKTSYIEAVIDWAAGTLSVYLNGLLVSAPTTGVTVATFQSFAVGSGVNGSNFAGQAGQANTFGITDIYFAVDTKNDPNPTGRLGQVIVRPSPVTAIANGSRFTTDDPSGDLVKGINALLDNNFTPSVTTAPSEEQVTVSFAPPVLADPTDSILGVTIKLRAFKDPLASAGLVSSVTDGTNTSTPIKEAVVNTGAITERQYVLSAPLDGTTKWTTAELAKLKLIMGSYRI